MSDDLLSEFIFDSREHLGTAGAQLLELEKNPGSLASLNALMGTMHTIKGNSGFLDLKNLYKLLHHAESLLQTIREKQADCPQPVIDLLLQVLDTVEAILNHLENGDSDDVDWLEPLNRSLSETETRLEGSSPPPEAAAPPPAASPVPAAPPPATAAGATGQAQERDLAGQVNVLPLTDGGLGREGDVLPARVEAMFKAGLSGLVLDLRALASLSGRELKLLLAAGQKRPDKTAFLLDNELQPALYHLFQVLRLDDRMRFFRDQEQALAYLKG